MRFIYLFFCSKLKEMETLCDLVMLVVSSAPRQREWTKKAVNIFLKYTRTVLYDILEIVNEMQI